MDSRLPSYDQRGKQPFMNTLRTLGFTAQLIYCALFLISAQHMIRKTEFLYLMSIHPHFHSLQRKANCLLAGSCMSGNAHVRLREKVDRNGLVVPHSRLQWGLLFFFWESMPI